MPAPSPRRRIFTITVSLCLGLLTTLVLAWAPPALIRAPTTLSLQETWAVVNHPCTCQGADYAGYRWGLDDKRGLLTRTLTVMSYPVHNLSDPLIERRSIPTIVQSFLDRDWPGIVPVATGCGSPMQVVRLSGWPLHCFWYGEAINQPVAPLPSGWIESPRCPFPVYHAHILGTWPPTGIVRAIPLAPLWPAILLNTVFFTALFLVLFSVPHRVRAGLRRRKGRCPRCGYSLTGLAPDAPCPECGAERGLPQPGSSLTH